MREPMTKVVNFLLERPFEVAFGTTGTIALRCETSRATVVRSARSLGYDGFVELRDAIRQSLRNKSAPALTSVSPKGRDSFARVRLRRREL